MNEKVIYIRGTFGCPCGGTMRAFTFTRLARLPSNETENKIFYEYHAENYEGDEYHCDKCGLIKTISYLNIIDSHNNTQSTQGEKI